MDTESRRKISRWDRTIRLIVEQTDESVDFGDFINEVVNFQEPKEGEVNKGPSKNEEQL